MKDEFLYFINKDKPPIKLTVCGEYLTLFSKFEPSESGSEALRHI